VALVIAAVILGAGAAVFATSQFDPLTDPLTWILLGGAILSELFSERYSTQMRVSAGFVAGMLALGLLGPTSAFFVPALTFIAVWIVERYRWQALLINVAASAAPTAIVAAAFQALSPNREGAAFVVLLAAAAILVMGINVLITSPLYALLDGGSVRQSLRAFQSFAPAVSLNIAVAAVIAEIYVQAGLLALVFVLLNLVGFTYMARLVGVARERAKQYANLSWGVLSGLIRTLDERDSRAARHCAAVAAFSRDIAKHQGMSKRDQELAHTAGLLHDIGKFALSDRVMERGATLEESDWRGIRRHPEIGAELLRDIGVYGPVAEIIRAHHERIDGRGYPHGLKAEAIPEIAKIVAVAEVYDTLTAPDTYRTPMTSFEALNELRRVAGSQLDGRYVEALAELLAGRGTDYRHADEADYDRELDIERRVTEATTLG